MIPQPTANETIVILPSNNINLQQTDQPKPTNQNQDILKKYLKAEVTVLATIQILCGMMVLSLGIILKSAPTVEPFTPVFSILLQAAYPFLGPLCFIISGSLSIITEKKSTMPLIQSSLAANILSSLFALVGFILLSVNLAALGPAFWECNLDKEDGQSEQPYYDFHSYEHDHTCYVANGLLAGMLAVMLLCTLLEFCLAALVAIVWWKQVYSDFPGNVFFQSLSHKDKSGTTAIFDPRYDDELTS